MSNKNTFQIKDTLYTFEQKTEADLIAQFKKEDLIKVIIDYSAILKKEIDTLKHSLNQVRDLALSIENLTATLAEKLKETK